ncbi:MAG: hypothetical protein ACREIT_08515 [Tepidisphaeraceae bacterium]
MGAEDISEEVKGFLTEHIDSVMQLEVLLLLHADTRKQWQPADVARELRVETEWVAVELSRMCARQLLSCTTGPDPLYRFDPRTPGVSRAVADLAKAYVDRRVTVIGLIFAKPTDKIRSFADAFRIRKEKGDG